jgi:hypothetical protein
MGLYADVLEFTAPPPTEAELLAHLRDQIGDTTGVEHYGVEGRRVALRCLFDPLTRPYSLAFLTRRGGVLVDGKSGAPLPLVLPAYVARPWREQPWWRRFRIRLRALLDPWSPGAGPRSGTGPGVVALLLLLTEVACAGGQPRPTQVDRCSDPGRVQPRVYDMRHQAPIFEAIGDLDVGRVKRLIARGADVNARDAMCGTPMMFAVAGNQYQIVFLLLEAGADPTLVGDFGATLAKGMVGGYIDPESDGFRWRQQVIAKLASRGIDLSAER